MNTNFEKVPVVIFDWIEKLSFEKLSHAQKKEVLLHFSEEDYFEMHRMALSLKTVVDKQVTTVNPQSKKALLAHFDKHHAKIEEGANKTLFIWQAAAVLLMMLSGWLFYQVFGMEKQFSDQQVAATDTVYVTKEIHSAPEIVHDTVYRYKEIVRAEKARANSSDNYIKSDSMEVFEEEEQMTGSEKSNSCLKGNSMKDDSLLRRFGFVAM